MQTLDKLQKQLLLGTEINAILKQSNKLLDIVKENQEYSHKLQAESDRLEKEIEAERLYTARTYGEELIMILHKQFMITYFSTKDGKTITRKGNLDREMQILYK